jgi:hypothetical protein
MALLFSDGSINNNNTNIAIALNSGNTISNSESKIAIIMNS